MIPLVLGVCGILLDWKLTATRARKRKDKDAGQETGQNVLTVNDILNLTGGVSKFED